MRRRTILLATASLVYGSPSVFSVHDDLLAFPQVSYSCGLLREWPSLISEQFEVVFSDSYVSENEAESRLSFASSSSSAKAKATSLTTANDPLETVAELTIPSLDTRGFTSDDTDSIPLQIPESFEYVVLDSSPYLCSIPMVDTTPQNKSSAQDSKAEEEKELARAADRGWELLKDLEGQCMYFISGWWSYSFCYNREVKQFHQLPPGKNGVPIFPPKEDQQVPSYVLGNFQAQGTPHTRAERQRIGSRENENQRPSDVARLQTKGDTRYLVQKLNGGTTCDLTGKDRKIEIQFHCHPQMNDRIGSIKEVSTCSYLMVIYTPRLCNDITFLPPRETKANKIVCREIVPDEEVEDWKIRKAAEAERKQLGAGEAQASQRVMVGDIELGGMKTVGKDGRRLEAPQPAQVVVGKTDVVAKGTPNENGVKVEKMSNEDLKKLDLDPRTVEELRKKLQELAGDKGWTLEVVDGPGGFRELRGIVEGDDEYEGNGDEGSQVDEDEGSGELYKDEL
jgi:protein OS-9